jgi:hypothetical protein
MGLLSLQLMNVLTYLNKPLNERQSHLNLESPCDHKGGRGGCRKNRMRRNLFTLLGIPYEPNIQQFGACLCHRCPNGRGSGEHYCVNPEHIYLGTFSENSFDTFHDNPELGKQITKNSQPKAVIAALSEKAKIKRKNTFIKNRHSQGERNSQFGTIWITNGTEKKKKLQKSDPIPEGYWRGRTLK